MSGCADSLTSRLSVPSATYFREFAPDRGPIKVRPACSSRRNLRVRIASSAVTPVTSRQRPSLDSLRFSQHESRNPASPSGFERHAATILLSPACPGQQPGRRLALDLFPRGSRGGASQGVLCRKNWLSARALTNVE